MLLRLLMVVLVLNLAACSTYKSNTITEFDSTDLGDREPALYVGKLDEPSDQLDYLGSIKAKVRKPHMFSDKPSKEMVDIVLAQLAVDKNAHAVTFVEYGYNLLGAIEAKGQAVRIKGVNANVKPEPDVVADPTKNANPSRSQLLQTATAEQIIELSDTPEQRAKGADRSVISQNLLHSFPKSFVGLNQSQVADVIARLEKLRMQASEDNSLSRYQAITEIIEILEKSSR